VDVEEAGVAGADKRDGLREPGARPWASGGVRKRRGIVKGYGESLKLWGSVSLMVEGMERH